MALKIVRGGLKWGVRDPGSAGIDVVSSYAAMRSAVLVWVLAGCSGAIGGETLGDAGPSGDATPVTSRDASSLDDAAIASGTDATMIASPDASALPPGDGGLCASAAAAAEFFLAEGCLNCHGGVVAPSLRLANLPNLASAPSNYRPGHTVVVPGRPTESELFWAATDPLESRRPETLLRLRTYTASLFHEQNHRVLWDFLPPPPSEKRALQSYLNFTESLVITLDMALGDQLGPKDARLFYLAGSLYDPGTESRRGKSRREYRNYLHAAAYATYLNLELYSPKRIPEAISLMFPGEDAQRACERALRLDEAFVTRTNPQWQKKHARTVAKALARKGQVPLKLGSNPLDNRVAYLTTELWFDKFGI